MTVDSRGARERLLTCPRTARAARAAPRRGRARARSAAGVLACAAVLSGTLCAPRAALAQQDDADPRSMTVEELERFIDEQKAALELVRENRDITAEKAREVREALADKEAERLATEAEFEELCRERDALEPGSFEACLEEAGE